MEQKDSQVTTGTRISPPQNYSEAIQLAQLAKRLCFVTFSCPDKDDLPSDIDIHKSLVDDCPEGIEDYPWEDIAIARKTPIGIMSVKEYATSSTRQDGTTMQFSSSWTWRNLSATRRFPTF